MALPNQKFRELVFLCLYSYDLGQANNEDLISLIMKELSVTRRATLEAQERARLIINNLEELDEVISKISSSYSFNRIQSVERNALRLGVFELLHDPSIPPKVAISEAMRLTRKFATPSGALFVNAVLDHLYRQSKGESTDDHSIIKSVEALNQSEEIARQASLEKKNESSTSEK